MKRLIQMAGVLAVVLMCGRSSAAQVSFDLHIGQAPPPPRSWRVPRMPGPDYIWIEGYWYPVRGRWVWHDGYWTRPPYPGAYWVAPYWLRGEFFPGQWEGGRGVIPHDHRWDRTRDRDDHRDRDDRRDRDRDRDRDRR